MTTSRDSNWRILLLALAGGAGGVLCLGIAASAAAYALVEPWLRPVTSLPHGSQDSTGVFILSVGMGLVAAILLATMAAALRAIRGQAAPNHNLVSIRWLSLALWTCLWLAASILAQVLYDQDLGPAIIPFLHVVAIACPIYVLIRVALAGIQGGSRLRLWATLSSGMVLGTGLAASVEIGLLLLGAIAGAIYLMANPVQIQALQRLALQLTQAGGPEETLALFGPMLASPLTLLGALAAVAVASPFIEEIAKSVPLWLLGRRITTGAEGFWAGALSGAGFALLEGLMVSANAGEGAASMLMLRAGSSLMHIVASGLAGWGIGKFRASGRAASIGAGYLGAMGIHALWNTAIVVIAYGGLRVSYGSIPPGMTGLALSIGGMIVLFTLIALLPVILILLNRKLRASEPGLAANGPSPSSMLLSKPAGKDSEAL